MSRLLYHGSDRIIRAPRFGAGYAYNDFGLGFYCSEYAVPASEWASARGRNGFVSVYSFNDDGLRVLNLCSSQYTPLHWLSVLFNFREFDLRGAASHRAQEYIVSNFSTDIQGHDCIIGYRADNSCFALARAFMSGTISYGSLRRALNADLAFRQFVLKSNRAFDRISFSRYEAALADEHFPVSTARELKILKKSGFSRDAAPEPCEAPVGRRELYISDLMSEEVKAYDPRLR